MLDKGAILRLPRMRLPCFLMLSATAAWDLCPVTWVYLEPSLPGPRL